MKLVKNIGGFMKAVKNYKVKGGGSPALFQKSAGLTILLLLILTSTVYSREGYKKRNIRFKVHKNANMVFIVGNFKVDNDKEVAIPLLKKGREFYLTLKLEPGFYLYRYSADGRLFLDPYNKSVYKKDGVKYSLLKIFPEEVNEFLKLARKYEKENYDWAVEIYIKGIRKFPKNIALYLSLGELYENKRLFAFAADCYHSFLEKNPKSVEMRYRIALCYEKFYLNSKKKKYKNYAKFHWKKLLGTKYDKEARRYLAK